MISPDVDGRGPSALRLAGIGITRRRSRSGAGRDRPGPDGQSRVQPFRPSVRGRGDAEGTAGHRRPWPGGLQVLLALWIYRKLPLAGSAHRPVRLAHRLVGFALFALTVPIALHCLIAYGVQFTSVRVAVHSLAGCFFYGAFVAKVLWSRPGACPDGCCRWQAERSQSSSSCSGTPRRCGTTTATSCRFSKRRITAVPRLCVRPSASPAAGMNRRAMAERSGRYGEARGRPPCREDGQQGAAR